MKRKERTVKLEIDGLCVTVKRKSIKRMYLRVVAPDAEIVVSCPFATKDGTIEAFVSSYRAWIDDNVKKVLSRKTEKPTLFESGEKIFLFGKEYTLEVLLGAKRSFVLLGDRAVLTVKETDTVAEREKTVKKRLRELLTAEIEKRMPYWEGLTNLHCTSFSVRQMKRTWGRCYVNRATISFNLDLAYKSPSFLDYIILHELAHLKHRGHGRAFKAFLSVYMPDWKQREKGTTF